MKTDVRETDGTYELDIDLPGFKKDEINAEIRDGYLTVSAAKGLDKDQSDKDGRYIRRERYAGQCSRSFYVGEGVTEQDISAKFEDGILRLSIPKKTQPQLPETRRIAIEYHLKTPGGHCRGRFCFQKSKSQLTRSEITLCTNFFTSM